MNKKEFHKWAVGPNWDITKVWSHKQDYLIDKIYNTDNTLTCLIIPHLQAFSYLESMAFLLASTICVHGTIQFKRRLTHLS